MVTMKKRRLRDFLLFRVHGDQSMGLYFFMFTVIIYSLNYLTVTFLCFWCSLEDNSGSSRRTRLLRLCSYLQEKYKHMCRKERASIRQKRYRYAFRKALLHAASNNPDCAGQLIQELSGASWYSHNYILQICLAFHRHLIKKKIDWSSDFAFLYSVSDLHKITNVRFCCWWLSPESFCLCSLTPVRPQSTDPLTCTGSTKGQLCKNRALPFTKHCFQRILCNATHGVKQLDMFKTVALILLSNLSHVFKNLQEHVLHRT